MDEHDDILSLSKIEGLPWAEAGWDTIHSTVRTGYLRWCQLALDIGVKKMDESSAKYAEELNNVCLRLMSDLESHKSEILDDMEELLNKLQSLCKKLHIKMPQIEERKKSLIDTWEELDSKVKHFEKMVEKREKEIQVFRTKQEQLCKALGIPLKPLRESPLPTASEIEEFQSYLEKLEEEKFIRTEQFLTLKVEIIALANELKMVPTLNFEKLVISGADDDFAVTDSNMKQLRVLHSNLTTTLENIKEQVGDLRCKINDLWDRLEIDIMEREQFRNKHVGHSQETLEALKAEFKRCEEIKKANIKVFIDKLRDELLTIWDQCHCTQSERKEFEFFGSDCFNEDLLQLHELALSQWKLYYEQNKELLSLLEKHNKLWKKLLELETSATNSDRYKNRGGQLLKEEKERNRLNKLIPKIEEDLERLAEEFFENNRGKTFTTFGKTIREYIDDLHSERENMMKIKLSARKQQREQFLTPSKSRCNLFQSGSTLNLATPVPLSTTKRRNVETPRSAISSTKKLKLEPVEKIPKSTSKKVPTIKVARASTERKRRISKRRQRRISHASSKDHLASPTANDTVSTQYHDFQNDLSSKGDCRSTILPEEIQLITKATPSLRQPLKKPPRTPISFRATPRQLKSPRMHGTTLSACKTGTRLIF